MGSISYSGEFNDVVNDAYLAISLSISTTPVLLKVGSTNLVGREIIIIENKSGSKVYIGPSGVTSSTGIVLDTNQFITFPAGDNINMYAVTQSGTSTIVVQEMA